MEAMGLGCIEGLGYPVPTEGAGVYGRSLEASAGKDTTTGHWELMGIRLQKPFPLYPEGFPPEVMDALKLLDEPEPARLVTAEDFQRPDAEKQFLYRLLLEEPDPDAAMENYRKGLMRINSQENYDRFLSAGFPVLLRDETRTAGETLALAERIFGLA